MRDRRFIELPQIGEESHRDISESTESSDCAQRRVLQLFRPLCFEHVAGSCQCIGHCFSSIYFSEQHTRKEKERYSSVYRSVNFVGLRSSLKETRGLPTDASELFLVVLPFDGVSKGPRSVGIAVVVSLNITDDGFAFVSVGAVFISTWVLVNSSCSF